MFFQISAIVGKKSLMLINLNEPQNPFNLQFQHRYGNLINYVWVVHLINFRRNLTNDWQAGGMAVAVGLRLGTHT